MNGKRGEAYKKKKYKEDGGAEEGGNESLLERRGPLSSCHNKHGRRLMNCSQHLVLSMSKLAKLNHVNVQWVEDAKLVY